MPDLTRATELTPEIEAEIDAMFEYRPWDAAQQAKGVVVREAPPEASQKREHAEPAQGDNGADEPHAPLCSSRVAHP